MTKKRKSKVKKKTKKTIDNLELSPENIAKMEAEATENFEKKILPEIQEETEEALKEFNEIISTEDELVELFSPQRFEISIVYKQKLLKFTIKPMAPGDDLSVLDVDQQVYANLTEEEKKIIEKIGKGEELTEEESKTIQDSNKRARQETASNQLGRMHLILAQFVTPPEFDGDIDKKVKFWEGVDFILKTFLTNQIMDKLGFHPDAMVKLFQGDG